MTGSNMNTKNLCGTVTISVYIIECWLIAGWLLDAAGYLLADCWQVLASFWLNTGGNGLHWLHSRYDS